MSGESKTGDKDKNLESVKRERDEEKVSHKKGKSAGAKDSSVKQLREFLKKTKNAMSSGMYYDPILGKERKAFIKEKGKSYYTHSKLLKYINAAKKKFGPQAGNGIVNSMADFQGKLMTQKKQRTWYKMMRDDYEAQKNQPVAEPDKKKQKTKGQYSGESKQSAGGSKQSAGESKVSAGESKMEKMRREREEKMRKRYKPDKRPTKLPGYSGMYVEVGDEPQDAGRQFVMNFGGKKYMKMTQAELDAIPGNESKTPEAGDVDMEQAQSLGKRRRKKNYKAMSKKLKYGMEVPSNVYVQQKKTESKTEDAIPIETKEQEVAGADFPGETKTGAYQLKPREGLDESKWNEHLLHHNVPGADNGANIDFAVNEILDEAEHNANMLNIPESRKRKPGESDSGPDKKKARFGPQDKNPVLPKRDFDPGPDFPFPPPDPNYALQIPPPVPQAAPQPDEPQPDAGPPEPGVPPPAPPGGPPGGPPDAPDGPEGPQLLEITKGPMGGGMSGSGVSGVGQYTTLASQRISRERNRMKHSAKRLLLEIRAFKQLYKDEIKTEHFKRLMKLCSNYTEKTPAIQLRKTHREMEEEVISFYQKATGLRLGVILDPGAIGINVGQLQGILQPHAGFAGGGEVVRELANAAEAGTVPDRVQKVSDIHYTHGGYAVSTKQVSPEGQNINSRINVKERIQLLRGKTARIQVPQEPKRRYMYQDRRRPFVPRNIKIKSVKH